MPTQAVPTHSRIRGFLFTAVTAATAGAVVGVLTTTTLIGHGLGNVRAVTTVESQVSSRFGSADAAEKWLTRESAVRDLPRSADAAEHWLCHAP